MAAHGAASFASHLPTSDQFLDPLLLIQHVQVNLIQLDDYPADSCAINPTTSLLQCKAITYKVKTFNPFSTEPVAVFLLVETDNLGIIH